MAGKSLMVVGASSNAGKSLLVAALCRIYARRGVRVAPFKAQNMSNNAAVCAGGEIGRAQAVQAVAAGVTADVRMNPILLKPEADAHSQVVLKGKVWRTLPAGEYYKVLDKLWGEVKTCLDDLRSEYDLVLMEGAGSPAELNLKRGDIVNMKVALYADAPTLLVGDVDRGGVFAQLLGTLWLLPEEEQALIKGFIVNKFRGERALFYDGEEILEQRSGVPVLGVVPYLYDHGIAEEDAVVLDEAPSADRPAGELDIVVIRVHHISNFDDFDPLALEPGVRVRYIRSADALGHPDAIILPGTKSTIADLDWLHTSGLSAAIRARAKEGAAVVGICGGYQMLGGRVSDPDGVESSLPEIEGLGLLPVETRFEGEKATYRAEGRITAQAGFLAEISGERIEGYEIHMGRTDTGTPLAEITRREGQVVSLMDGCVSADGRIFGSYLHGLFDNDNFRRAWLKSLGGRVGGSSFSAARERAFENLADAVEEAMDMDKLDQILGL